MHIHCLIKTSDGVVLLLLLYPVLCVCMCACVLFKYNWHINIRLVSGVQHKNSIFVYIIKNDHYSKSS